MVDIPNKPVAEERQTLYWHFNRFLERHLPEGLYPRSLIIIIAPIVILQAIMAFVFMERHWDRISTRLSKAVAREISFLVELYETMPPTKESRDMLEKMAKQRLALGLEIRTNETLPPPAAKPLFSLLDFKLSKQIRKRVGRPYWIDILGKSGFVDIRIQVGKDTVFRVVTDQSRAYASNSYIFILWMVGSSLVLLAVAVVFLRNQILPIKHLAEAAQSFGMGRDVPDFSPRGASEVQSAARAVIGMNDRIQRHVSQRTAMLAGVSHDLRTILTRFRLQLAVFDDTAQVEELKRDVDEMQSMLEGYMNFVRGDGGERAVVTDVNAMLSEVERQIIQPGLVTEFAIGEGLNLKIKSSALKRCVSNLVNNAARHADYVKVTAKLIRNELSIVVEDNGPGISEEQREEVLKPFVRLDDARNQDDTGSGLGLTIALDIARSHGGELDLSDSELGGLKANLRIPI